MTRLPRLWRIVVPAAAAVAVGVALVIAVAWVVPLSSDVARRRLAEVLSSQFDGEVDIQALHWRVFPSPVAEGEGLTVRHRGRRDVPPLITIARFSATGSVLGLLGRHISQVAISGLDIEIPPDRNRDETSRGLRRSTPTPESAEHTEQQEEPDAAAADTVRTLVIDDLVSTDARLAIIPSNPTRDPKVWRIHSLHMRSVGFNRAMAFQATLANALPPGEIDAAGTFGPWRSEEPGLTPVDGSFTFDDANLGVFKGVTGILTSRGTFAGVLARLELHGTTDTPRFKVSSGDHPVSLATRYRAIVDGTNGNTILQRVDASFLGTSLVAAGGVIGSAGTRGRTVSLDVKIDNGRLEDVLALAVKAAKAPMTGSLRLDAKFVLPPGDEDVVKKLRLKGRFTVVDTRFSNLDVQGKINELSHRSRGRPLNQPRQRVASRFTGTFAMEGGTLEMADVSFDVPGSIVRLSGDYDLLPETLNFTGTLFMEAAVSQTTSGLKRVLLKIVDPLFRRDGGGSAIPIRITGIRTNPSFRLDTGRVFRRFTK